MPATLLSLATVAACAALSAVTPAAVQLQRAAGPRAILETALARRTELPAPALAAALLRASRLSMHANEAAPAAWGGVAAAVADGLGATAPAKARAAAVDALWASGIARDAAAGAALIAPLAACGALSDGQVAAVAWSCARLGLAAPPEAAARADAWPWRVHPDAGLARLPGVSLESLLLETAPEAGLIRSPTDGALVPERRGTAWQAEAHVPQWGYSGKAPMVAVPLSPAVATVRDALAETLGVRFDSVLVNYYPDGASAMKYV